MFINFQYDIKKDIQNYKIIAKAYSTSSPSWMLELYKKQFGDLLDEDALTFFINQIIQKDSLDFLHIIKEFKFKWYPIEGEYLSRCERIFDFKIPVSSITAYLTTNDKCSYSYMGGYFFVRANTNFPLKTIMHELLHFAMLTKFAEEFRNLDKKIAYHILESFTELLNLEFNDLLDTPDRRYFGHEKARDIIRKEWRTNKDINLLFVKVRDLFLSENQ